MNKIILYILALSLFIPAEAFAKRKPGWVKKRPNDASYYIGIAMSPKKGDSRDYVKTTRAKALKQMSSEIKVKVSSNSVLHQLDDLGGFREDYEAVIRTSVEETIEGYEVETWENRKEYWVMVRLSKERYRRMQQMKLDMAKSHAFSFLEDARKAVEENDAYTALHYLSKAVESIKDHLEEDLTYHNVDGTFNLGTDIYGFIQEVFHRIELSPVKTKYLIHVSKDKQVPIQVKAKFYITSGGDVPLAGLPLNFSFTKGEGVLSSNSVTDPGGVAETVISRLISKQKNREIKCSLDLSVLNESFPDEDSKKIMEVFFPQKLVPATYIKIDLQKSSAYLHMDEEIFGVRSSMHSFLNSVKTILNESFFTFIGNEEDAGFIVNLKSNFVEGEEKKGNGYSLYIVFADFNISVLNAKTGEEVLSDGFNGVRGIRPGSFEYALKDARKNALKMFREKIMKRLEQLNM